MLAAGLGAAAAGVAVADPDAAVAAGWLGVVAAGGADVVGLAGAAVGAGAAHAATNSKTIAIPIILDSVRMFLLFPSFVIIETRGAVLDAKFEAVLDKSLV
jgi:hypothetical protein